MNRRHFLRYSTSACVFTCLAPYLQAETTTAVQHLAASGVTASLRDMSTVGRRASFKWEVAGIAGIEEANAEPVEIKWEQHGSAITTSAKLRLCVLDTREPNTPVEAVLPSSGRVVGTFDLQWVGQFQVHEISLSAADAAAVQKEGVRLRQTVGKLPVWFISGQGKGPELPDSLRPHLLPDQKSDPMAEYFLRMNSLACIQPFGWMEGSVLDGLQALSQTKAHAAYRKAFLQHLNLFFKPDGRFNYESPRGEVNDNRMSGIEGMLPWAALAWENPDHPSIEKLLTACRKMAEKDPDGCIQDGDSTSTEGAYTVGYPLATIARQRKDEALAQVALTQIMVRQQRVFDGKILSRVSRRQPAGEPKLFNKNWCRGVTWQFLGMARTMKTLQGFADISAARKEFVRVAEWITPYQLPNGLWSVFVDEPTLSPDTSGSAGIAAALALGVRQGWLPATYLEAAKKTRAGLLSHLTPDGFLGGASQSNKGGEALQRSSYRVIYQMGMGLLAQLIAALEEPSA